MSLSPEALGAFTLAGLVLFATPGPAVLAAIAIALRGGVRPAARYAFGVAIGDVILLNAAILGLAAVAEANAGAFLVIRVLGAGFLIWQGWRALRAALRGPAAVMQGARVRGSLAAGVATPLANPRAIVFYLAIAPGVVDFERITAIDAAVLSGVVLTLLTGVLVAYAALAGRAREALTTRPNVRRGVDAVSALAFFAAAALVALRPV